MVTTLSERLAAVDGATSELAYAALAYLETVRGHFGGVVIGGANELGELLEAARDFGREERLLAKALEERGRTT